MEKAVLWGSIVMGLVLVVLQRIFPDFVTAWFAAPLAQADVWRSVLLGVLIVSAITRELMDNRWLRASWLSLAVAAGWGTVYYVSHYPVFMFDILYMAAAGCFFGMAGLQIIPAEFPALQTIKDSTRRQLHYQLQLYVQLWQWSSQALGVAFKLPDYQKVYDSSHNITMPKPKNVFNFTSVNSTDDIDNLSLHNGVGKA